MSLLCNSFLLTINQRLVNTHARIVHVIPYVKHIFSETLRFLVVINVRIWDLCWSMPSYSNKVMYYISWRCFVFFRIATHYIAFRVFEYTFLRCFCVCVRVCVCYKSSLPRRALKLSTHKNIHMISALFEFFWYVSRIKAARTHTGASPKMRINESLKWVMFHGWKATNRGANTNTKHLHKQHR